MCGIIGFIPKKKNAPGGDIVIQQHQDQFTRGKEGFGLLEVSSEGTNVHRSTEPIKAALDLRATKAPVLIFHHRNPTSTKNFLRQTHPLFISHDELKHDFYIVHNGVISNNDTLFKKHTEELGYVYKTLTKRQSTYGYDLTDEFNDSEALAIEISRYMEGLIEEMDVRGSAAWIGVSLDKKTGKPVEMFWGRNGGSPLDYRETEDGLLIASDIKDDAFIMPEFTAESINIDKYLARKRFPKKIIDTALIKTWNASFTKPPEPPRTEYLPGHTRSIYGSNRSGHLRHSRTCTCWQCRERGARTTAGGAPVGVGVKESIFSGKDDGQTDNTEHDTDPLREREVAFQKIAQRITRDIGHEIETLCEHMSYEPVSDDQIMAVCDKLQDLLWTKEAESAQTLRNLFDDKEDAQADLESSLAATQAEEEQSGLYKTPEEQEEAEKNESNANTSIHY